MITLNIERGFINIESWDDVLTLAGYQTDINLAEHTLDIVLGRYVEKDWVNCGLASCRTLHSKGYFVKTKSGLITNIGKDCGKKHLGVDFEVMAKLLDHDITAQNNRNSLASFSFQLDDLQLKVKELLEGEKGAHWIYKKSRPLITMNSGCPADVVKIINRMVKSSNSTLIRPREADEEEIAMAEAIKGSKVQRPYFIDEPIADIQGLQALREENDLRAILVLDIKTQIDLFKQLDIDMLDHRELVRWNKWFNSLDAKFELVGDAIIAGSRLLTRPNLEPFFQILTSTNDKAEFKTYLNSLD